VDPAYDDDVEAFAWTLSAPPSDSMLIRRHLKTGEFAFRYCQVPEGQPLTKTRLIRAAGLRWPVGHALYRFMWKISGASH
jgi:hypothetical protein